MSKLDARIVKEVQDLVGSGAIYIRNARSVSSSIVGEELAEIASWVTRLGQIIRHLYGDKSQHFESYNSALNTSNFYRLHNEHSNHLSRMVGVARSIQHDLETGLLVDFKALAQAEVFADFLEMGEYLLNGGYKDAAAVIIGSVLENGLRKLAERNGVPTVNDSGKPLTIDPLNSELGKREIYSKLHQKQITSWAHIRNKAAHGEFGEYNKEAVQMMLLYVQNFTAEYLK